MWRSGSTASCPKCHNLRLNWCTDVFTQKNKMHNYNFLSITRNNVLLNLFLTFRWTASCGHLTAGWTTYMLSFKNWMLTLWWREERRIKVCMWLLSLHLSNLPCPLVPFVSDVTKNDSDYWTGLLSGLLWIFSFASVGEVPWFVRY